MTQWLEWFRYQLTATADGFTWAFQQVDPQRHHALFPEPRALGEWSARLVWHVTEYERWIALPSMRQWVGEPLPDGDAWLDDDATWQAAQARPAESLIEDFHAVHQEQMELLDQLAGVDWTAPRKTIWGMMPLSWVVSKTYQHRLEHGNTLLRIHLFWDIFTERLAREMAQRPADETA